MYVGHKSTNLQNVPPPFCKFMSRHNFDISFHLPPQRAVPCHGEEPHAAVARRRRRRRTPPPPPPLSSPLSIDHAAVHHATAGHLVPPLIRRCPIASPPSIGEGGWRRQCVAALSGCLCIGGGGERGRRSRQRWACRGVVGAAAEQRPQGGIVGVGGGQRACCGAGGAAVGRRCVFGTAAALPGRKGGGEDEMTEAMTTKMTTTVSS